MLRLFLFIPLMFCKVVLCQRIHVEFKPSPNAQNEQYFSLSITNKDSIPLFIKIPAGYKLSKRDTLILSPITSCTNSSIKPFYDLDYTAESEENCVRWYSLQVIMPEDTIQVTTRLKDLVLNKPARLYISYSSNINEEDKRLLLYTDPKIIYIMKNKREFNLEILTID